jgi:hypothetical protein
MLSALFWMKNPTAYYAFKICQRVFLSAIGKGCAGTPVNFKKLHLTILKMDE